MEQLRRLLKQVTPEQWQAFQSQVEKAPCSEEPFLEEDRGVRMHLRLSVSYPIIGMYSNIYICITISMYYYILIYDYMYPYVLHDSS